MDRNTQRDEIWRALSTPDVIVGSVAAVTETGSLVAASATRSQLPGYAGAAARVIWVVGAQKVVPDLPAALRRVEDHCLPLENAGLRLQDWRVSRGRNVQRLRGRFLEQLSAARAALPVLAGPAGTA
jgi:hypothetical protein